MSWEFYAPVVLTVCVFVRVRAQAFVFISYFLVIVVEFLTETTQGRTGSQFKGHSSSWLKGTLAGV